MGLRIWNNTLDPYSSAELADNFARLDQHDHGGGRGVQITTAGIADGAVTQGKLADDLTLPTASIPDGSITSPKYAGGSVNAAAIATGAVGGTQLAGSAVATVSVADGAITPVKRSGGYKISNFLSHSTTGNKAITGLGFRPKLVRFSVIPDSTGTDTRTGQGAMDSFGNQWAWHHYLNVSGNVIRQEWSSSSCIYITGTPTTAVYQASYVSLDSDGFTINVTSGNSSYRVFWEALA